LEPLKKIIDLTIDASANLSLPQGFGDDEALGGQTDRAA
jgi:hypothetical protein